jgi:hypothetical protein
MAISVVKLESERDEARRELTDTLAAMAEKASATRAELFTPAFTAGVVIAACAGFLIGTRRDRALDPLVYAAAGYCARTIARELWDWRDSTE